MVSRRGFTTLALSALALSALPRLPAHGGAPRTIRIGAVAGGGRPSTTGALAVAVDQGFLEQEFARDGVAVEVQYFSGTGPAINEALVNRQVDIGQYGGLPNIIGLSGGVNAKVIMGTRSQGSYYVIARTGAGIGSAADLKGRRIAVQKGTMPYMLLVRFLNAHDLSERTVTVVDLKGADAAAAFAAGHIDALWGSATALSLRDQGLGTVVASTASLGDLRANVSGLLAHGEWLAANPDLAARIVKVLVKADHWASLDQNREDLLRILSKTGASIDWYREEYAGPLKERFDPRLDGDFIAGYQQIIDFAVANRLIRKPFDPRAVIDASHVEAALKDLRLEHYWS